MNGSSLCRSVQTASRATCVEAAVFAIFALAASTLVTIHDFTRSLTSIGGVGLPNHNDRWIVATILVLDVLILMMAVVVAVVMAVVIIPSSRISQGGTFFMVMTSSVNHLAMQLCGVEVDERKWKENNFQKEHY